MSKSRNLNLDQWKKRTIRAKLRKRILNVTTTPSPNNAKRILIVEDDPDIRHLIAIQMRLFKYEPVEVANGKAALQLIQSEASFDLVITDASMPELDGFQLTYALRACPAYSQVPIIMITALDEQWVSRRAYETGVSEFLGKPLDRLKFKTAVQSLLHPAVV